MIFIFPTYVKSFNLILSYVFNGNCLVLQDYFLKQNHSSVQDKCHVWGERNTRKNTRAKELILCTHLGNLFCSVKSLTMF